MIVNIDKILDNKGKTRYWLAKEVGITYPNLVKLCNNKTESIKFDILNKICNKLECTPNDILTITPLTHD
jgi:putative transcriptional regulator